MCVFVYYVQLDPQNREGLIYTPPSRRERKGERERERGSEARLVNIRRRRYQKTLCSSLVAQYCDFPLVVM